MNADGALAAADRRLARALSEQDALTLQVGPLTALAAEAGDRLTVEGRPGVWRVLRADVSEAPRLQLARAEFADAGSVSAGGAALRAHRPPRSIPGRTLRPVRSGRLRCRCSTCRRWRGRRTTCGRWRRRRRSPGGRST